jgi:hypothetical protein
VRHFRLVDMVQLRQIDDLELSPIPPDTHK